MNVCRHNQSCVRIESGRCTQSDDIELVGRWVHVVTFVEGAGLEMTDYIGIDLEMAQTIGRQLASSFQVRLFDRTRADPRIASVITLNGERPSG